MSQKPKILQGSSGGHLCCEEFRDGLRRSLVSLVKSPVRVGVGSRGQFPGC